MRAIWKGHIRFSLVTIPIRIYNAVDSSEKISFNQLHKEDNGPVGYDKKCKKCSKVLSSEDIVKGFQYEPDQYVIVQTEDLEKIKLKSTKIIEIDGFLDATEIHTSLYDAPYFAGPDGPVAAKTYNLLSETLKESGKIGIGKVVLRDREDVVLVAPQQGGLMLYKLRHPRDMRNMDEVPGLEAKKPDKKELELALHLVESMTKKLDDIDLADRYAGALREMIEAKISGKEVITVAEEEKPVVDIMTALKQSIEQAKSQKKPMQKATGQIKTSKEKTTKTKKQKVA